MYYFVDMYDGRLNFIDNISNEKCKEVIEALNSVEEILEFYNLGKCVRDAWDEVTNYK